MTASRIVGVILGEHSIPEFCARIDTLTAEHGEGLTIENGHGGFIVRTPGERCDCATCDEAERQALAILTGNRYHLLRNRMIVCPDCGNKRCPRASHHVNPCTRSNAPGQPGSAYTLPREDLL